MLQHEVFNSKTYQTDCRKLPPSTSSCINTVTTWYWTFSLHCWIFNMVSSGESFTLPFLSHPHQVLLNLLSLHAPPSLLTLKPGARTWFVLCKQSYTTIASRRAKQAVPSVKAAAWLQERTCLCQPSGGTCQEPDTLLHVLLQKCHWFPHPSNFSIMEDLPNLLQKLSSSVVPATAVVSFLLLCA